MTIYNWLCLLGIPSIVAGLLAIGAKYVKDSNMKYKAIQLGLQAGLKYDLLQLSDKCKTQGYATLVQFEVFEQLFEQYRNLGGNGVMLKVKEEFEQLSLKRDTKV